MPSPTEIPVPQNLPALQNGVLRGRDLDRQGISRQRVQRLMERGELVRIGRGLYALADAPMTENRTLAQVCARVPEGVICLLSALQFHQLTTQNPWQVWLLIERQAPYTASGLSAATCAARRRRSVHSGCGSAYD